MSPPEDKGAKDPADEVPPSKRIADGRPLRQSIKNPEYAQSPEKMAELVRAIANEPSLARPSTWEPDDARGGGAAVPVRATDSARALSLNEPPVHARPAVVTPDAAPSSSATSGQVIAPDAQEPWAKPRRRQSGPAWLFLSLAIVGLICAVLVFRAPRSRAPTPTDGQRSSSGSPPPATSIMATVPSVATQAAVNSPTPSASPDPTERPATPRARSLAGSSARDASPPLPVSPNPPNLLKDNFE